MANSTHLFDTGRDEDTLGGRIQRAREANGMTTAQFARRLGVKKVTMEAWENDRDEPRANRLTMIAGVLGISPAWLLSGLGEAPATETVSGELKILQAQLARIRDMHEQTGLAIENMERAIEGIASKEDG